jgi:predicted P-loop ATPase/GTPase
MWLWPWQFVRAVVDFVVVKGMWRGVSKAMLETVLKRRVVRMGCWKPSFFPIHIRSWDGARKGDGIKRSEERYRDIVFAVAIILV